MTVEELARGVASCRVVGDGKRFVANLVANHTLVGEGDAFVAIRGARFDGHDFLEEAVRRGAKTLVVEREPGEKGDVSWIRVPDTRVALAALAANFFRRPFDRMTLVGITGTNGKTSTAHLTQELLRAHGQRCSRLGTVGHEIAGSLFEAPNTTPDALELNRLLSGALDSGDTACVMEVSSHALCTHRVEHVLFDVAVWTNLTQDHLDFHKTMDDYRDAKLRLYRQLKPNGVAVLNRDDPAFPDFERVARERSDVRVLSFGHDSAADLRAEAIEPTPYETRFVFAYDTTRVPIRLHIPGDFNVMNALAALGVGVGLGLSPDALSRGIDALKRVPGRFESVNAGQPFAVVVDYAHTPDALERVLNAARASKPRRVLVVFGCGGDRDNTKRPIMGRIAARLADVVVVTSDNPRTEDPARIIAQIEAGIPAGRDFTTIPSREEAIAYAVSVAEPGDMLVIAGKGHEDYQILGTTKVHFDDREVARKYLEARFPRES
jgi:UDP-N-acetylmuramoyl-L-alanyl-D-glutamate--2,6-diaminopimelate ligase